MGDMFGDIFGIFSGINNTMGSGLAGVLVMLQFPLIIIFTLSSAILFFLLFGNKFHLILPWEWRYFVTMIRPYANGKVGVFQDKGALCNLGGFTRFKLKKENKLMQKPDTTDVYQNNEIIVISMGPDKKFNGKREIDYKNHKVIFDVETPQVAQQYYTDHIQETDPDFLMRRVNQLYLLWLIWFFSGIMVAASNFLIIYPIFVRFLFR